MPRCRISTPTARAISFRVWGRPAPHSPHPWSLGRASAILDLDQTGTSLDLKGKIRFGTASAAQGLGTGRNDYALSLELDQRLPGGASLFASFGRSFPVSTPDLALHQVWFGSVGADYKLAPRWTAALWLDMRQATTATSGRVAEVTADLTYRISRAWKIDVYGVKGFAAGSPAVAGGIVLTWQHRF